MAWQDFGISWGSYGYSYESSITRAEGLKLNDLKLNGEKG